MRKILLPVLIVFGLSLSGCGMKKAFEFSWLCRQAHEITNRKEGDPNTRQVDFLRRVENARWWAGNSHDFAISIANADPAQRIELIRAFSLEMTPNATECADFYTLFVPATKP